MSPAVDLAGRTAIVTGGASGIGLACARRLAAGGARVTVVDLDGEAAARAADEIGGDHRVADLTDPDAADRLGVSAGIIVNNAGFQVVSPLQDFPVDRFGAMLRLMVETPFRLIRASLPGMYEAGWGRVVNISSAHGRVASPYKSAYVTAKHALEGLSKVVALEGAAHGVTSNCIAPGYVRTPLVEKQIADQAAAHGIPESDVVAQVLLERTALKRLAEPEDVAELAAYLCSPAAAMVTGASLSIDGGWTAG